MFNSNKIENVRMMLENLRNYLFQKQFSSLLNKETFLPPTLDFSYYQVNLPFYEDENFQECIKKFTEVICQNFPSKDLIIFFNNIRTLQYNPPSLESKNPYTKLFKACYNGEHNAIFCHEEYEYNYHELFHMASYYSKDGISYSGFKQSSIEKDYFIGSAINEGYTELLAERYFGQEIGEVKGYTYLTHIAHLVELIVGEGKMTRLYLRANLNGLIYELNKYVSKEEIIEFLLRLDYLNYIATYKKSLFLKQNEMKWFFNKIYEFLAKAYTEKQKIIYEKGEMEEEELYDIISEYISLFKTRYIIDNTSFRIIRVKNIERILQRSLKNPNIVLNISEC